MSECRSCGAPVRWAITPTGAKAPIDFATDSEKGNVLLLQPEAFGGELFAVTLSKDALALARQHGELRTNHYATCPDRQQWRERTDAEREGQTDGS